MRDMACHLLFPSSRIAAYEIDRLLGRGSMASVYACRSRSDGRVAAVKIMHPHLAGDKIATARFVREALILSRVIHPNVVEILDVGVHEGVPYFAMSLADGDELAHHMRRLHPMSMMQIADCMLPVIDAVSAAHDAGVVHRDLKPRNIRIARDLRGNLIPKVLDFGISKLKEDNGSTDLTETGAALGTLNYMSPEQLRSAKRVDARSDLYALGVILYECATGVRPFHGDSNYYLMHAILTASVALPSSFRPDIPSSFDTIVLRAMAREPSERFGSARELRSALASALEPARTSSVRPSPPSVPTSGSRIRADAGAELRGAQVVASGLSKQSTAKAWYNRPTMLFMTEQRVVVFVNRPASPTDEEWNSYLDACVRAGRRYGPPRVLAVTQGGP
jgi:serine/threonine-protein kinase